MTKKELLNKIEKIESDRQERTENLNKILKIICSELGKELVEKRVVTSDWWEGEQIVTEYELIKKSKVKKQK